VGALLGARLAGAPGLAVAAVAVVGAAPLGRVWRRHRAARRYDDELVRLLRAVARSLRSGAVLRVALGEASVDAVGPLGADLARLTDDIDHGMVPALRAWAVRRPTPAVRLVAGGLAVGHASGGIDAAVVDSLAETIRLRLDGRDEASALATQATLSALVLAGAPLAFLLLGVLGGSALAGFLLHRPLGRVCLGVGILADVASLGWMLRAVRSVER
jgi:tight adherence protein B